MARTRLDDIRPEAKFGRRLYLLGEKHGLRGPAAIGKAIYDNLECFLLFCPGGRNYRYEFNEDKDLPTIRRRVDEHLDVENAYDLSGNYMYAYSILFNCSLDFLYGKIDEECPNLEVLDISKKTGLSVKAVKKLMAGEEICMEEYLLTADHYGLLDRIPDTACGTDADDDYVETYASVTEFWSSLIESDLFTALPENWYRMACALFTSKGVRTIAEDAEKIKDELPPLDTFLSWVDTWNALNPQRPLYRIDGLDEDGIRELYEKEPDLIKQLYREIRHEHLYSAEDKADDLDDTYWGCAGKFDRHTLDFLHEKAEEWCNSGPLSPKR